MLVEIKGFKKADVNFAYEEHWRETYAKQYHVKCVEDKSLSEMRHFPMAKLVRKNSKYFVLMSFVMLNKSVRN